MKVEDYNKELDNKANIINRAIAIFNSSTTTAEDVASSIKSVELIYTAGLLDSFEDFYPKLFNKINNLSSSDPSATNLLFLARGLQKVNNDKTDFDYFNIKGEVVIGDRTLEDFDDKILEEFYQTN